LPPASYVEANGRLRGWCHPQAHAAKAPPLLESVELTPGGSGRHACGGTVGTLEQSCAVAMRGAKAATTVAVILPPASYVEANGRLRGCCHPQAHAAKAPPLLESVELTPGGRRKHVLTRRSPGGTQRTAQYISPSKAEIMEKEGYNAQIADGKWSDDDDLDFEVKDDLELERWVRRQGALHKVPGMQSDAQRSAKARSKRAAGVPPAPPAKRVCDFTGAVHPPLGTCHSKVAGALFG
jgi:hypothetical protein